jgi:hypothetical protein
MFVTTPLPNRLLEELEQGTVTWENHPAIYRRVLAMPHNGTKATVKLWFFIGSFYVSIQRSPRAIECLTNLTDGVIFIAI